MKFNLIRLEEKQLIKESVCEIHYNVSNDVNVEHKLKITILDPFFNIEYIPGSMVVDVFNDINYWVRFNVDEISNNEKPNLKFGVRIQVEDLSTNHIIYDEVIKTHHKSFEMRNHSLSNPEYLERAWIIGDSNVWASFGDTNNKFERIGRHVPIRVSQTSLTLNRFVNGDFLGLLDSLPIQEKDVLVFYLGEIDFRYTIHKHCENKNITLKNACLELMDSYFNSILKIKEIYNNRIVILSPNPPMRDGFLHEYVLGTEDDRKLCSKLFDTYWKNKIGFIEYLDWTKDYTLPDGLIDTSKLCDNNHHIRYYNSIVNLLSKQLSKSTKTNIMKTNEPKELVDYCLDFDLMEKCIFMQVYEEILTLSYWLNGFKPHNILEIGTMGSTFWLMSKLSTGKKVSVDIEPRQSIIHHFMCGEDWKFFQGDSHTKDMFEQVKDFCPKYDFIFIDGDHTYDGVKHDFELYKNLLSPRGVIGFHDIDPNHIFADSYAGQVYKFWQDLDEGTKINLVCTKSSGNVKLNGQHSQGFGGIGLWRP
jgi:predicted O-methyltransferase YrrM